MRRCAVAVILALIPCALFAQSNVDQYVFTAAEYHYRGELDRAADLFLKVLQAEPNHDYANNQLALIYAKKGNVNGAVHGFQAVKELDPQNTFARVWLGVMYLQKGNMDRASSEFQDAVRIDPKNADAHYFLGALYAIRHNMEKAIEELKLARDARSIDPETHFRLAKAFHSAGLTQNALLEYIRTLELNPRHVKALAGTGWLYWNSGDRQKAMEIWYRAHKIAPKDKEIVFSLAKAHNDQAAAFYRAGNKKAAAAEWRKVLSIESGNKAARWYLDRLG